MKQKYVIVLDQGTTSSRTIIYNLEGKIVANEKILLTQSYPKEGWVEHDALEIWNAQYSTLQQAILRSKINISDIESLGITNQRETIVAWNKDTGLPIYNAIVWQDNRTINYCKKLKKYSKTIFAKTGLLLNTYFSALKIKWIIENVSGAKKMIKENKLMVGTIDSWLIYKLTRNHYTDYTNASRTMLLNIHNLEWDDELLKIFGIPKKILPNLKSSSSDYGYVLPDLFSSDNKVKIPINAVAGDQQSSLYGHLCWKKGDVKITYGTGAFVLMNTKDKFIVSKNNLLTSLSCETSEDNPLYVLEGSVFNSGSVIEWLINDLKILYNPKESAWYYNLALTKNSNSSLYFVPAFHGLGAPHWNSEISGSLFGITRSTKREDIIKAAIDGIAYQCKDVINAMKSDSSLAPTIVKTDGGLSENFCLLQFQANLMQIEITKSDNIETSSLGIYFLVAKKYNYWNHKKHIIENIKSESFFPKIDKKESDKLYKGWQNAIRKTLM